MSLIIAIAVICITIFVLAYSNHNCLAKEELGYEIKDRSVKRFCIWVAGVYVCTFLSISFIGGEYVFLRYIYYIGPALYILIAYIIKCFCRIRPQALNLAFTLALVFAVSNAVYGAVSDMSPYLYKADCRNDAMLKTFHDHPLVMLTSRNPAVPTGNLTKMMIFKQIYISDYLNVIGENIVGECLRNTGDCVIYINTDTYFTDGYDAIAVINEIIENNKEMTLNYEYLCGGSLGEYYRLSVQTTS